MSFPAAAIENTPERFSFRELLGDTNENGVIDAGEQPASTGPYLLISGGVDGFGRIEIPSAGYYWFVTTPICNFDVRHTK